MLSDTAILRMMVTTKRILDLTASATMAARR